MITRRNYFIIVVLMVVMFVLFQFSQMLKDSENNYNTNQYSSLEAPERNEWIQHEFDLESLTGIEDDSYILFLGKKDSAIGSIVSQWTLYSKRDVAVCSDASKLDVLSIAKPEFVIVDSDSIDFEKDASKLYEIANNGYSIVFCNMPSFDVISKVEGLQDFFGISYLYKESVTASGIKLFSGFLLGGEVIYQPEKESEVKRQDLNLDMPWYVLSGGSKTYMVGLTDELADDYVYKNDYYPAIIWRHSLQNAQIFCVNGDYMSDTAGLGILSSMINELTPYQIYPIVNAQNTLVIDYPIMADENEEEFNEIYSRSLERFQIDVTWPSLVTLAEKNGLKYTCFLTPKYNYDDKAEAQYSIYDNLLLLFKERDNEVGMSLEYEGNISVDDKLEYDKTYYDGLENKYEFTSAFMYLSDLDSIDSLIKEQYVRNVRTIACDQDVYVPILSYLSDDITLQSLTSNTKNFTYSRDLMLKSIETALGYDNAKLNMSDVAWPEDEGDQWENIYNDMSSSVSTYWTKFRVFDRTTLTEADQRVRNFLNLSYTETRQENEITLSVDGVNGQTCWFILRTHGEKIDEIDGATYEEIEENAYLIEVNSSEVSIILKNTKTIE